MSFKCVSLMLLAAKMSAVKISVDQSFAMPKDQSPDMQEALEPDMPKDQSPDMPK